MPGTWLEASAALGPQDLMATWVLVLETSSQLPRNIFCLCFVFCLQQLAGERFQKMCACGIRRQPLTLPFPLAKALQRRGKAVVWQWSLR